MTEVRRPVNTSGLFLQGWTKPELLSAKTGKGTHALSCLERFCNVLGRGCVHKARVAQASIPELARRNLLPSRVDIGDARRDRGVDNLGGAGVLVGCVPQDDGMA